jgi:hypothetical protein
MALTPPFANTGDLAARWRSLSTAEATRAETLLEDASQMILDEDKHGVLAALTEPPLTLRRIVCKMVERAMGTDIETPAVSQFSQTMGPFTEQRTFANPSGELYLTKAERRQLRFSRQRAGSVSMWDDPDEYA